MSRAAQPWSEPGPFRADQIREGDHYELSNGHAIHCMTAGGRHGSAHIVGAAVLTSDPGLDRPAGIDVGISWNDGKNLRAPDIVVGVDLSKPGWIHEPPPLAVEYADVGQDEQALDLKVRELLEFGTRLIWVVRLVGPLRVEVHEPGVPVRVVPGDGELRAPGVLQNPVPVRALVDPEAAHEVTLRNILARQGYASLEAFRAEAREEGREEARSAGRSEGREESQKTTLAEVRATLIAQLGARGWSLTPAMHARIAGCSELATLLRWLTRVAVCDAPAAVLE